MQEEPVINIIPQSSEKNPLTYEETKNAFYGQGWAKETIWVTLYGFNKRKFYTVTVIYKILVGFSIPPNCTLIPVPTEKLPEGMGYKFTQKDQYSEGEWIIAKIPAFPEYLPDPYEND